MKNKGKKLIRKKVTRRVVVSLLITVLLISVANTFYMSTRINSNQKEELTLVTLASGEKLDNWVGDLVGISTGISNSIEGLHSLDGETITKIIDRVSQQYPELCFVYVATEEGDMYMADGIIFAEGVDVRERPWYKAVKASGETTIIDPYISATRPDIMLATVATPVYFDGELVAIVGVDADVSTIGEFVQGLGLSNGAYGFLVDSQNKIVFHPNARWNPTITKVTTVDEVMPELKDEFNNPTNNLISSKDYQDTRVMYNVSKIDTCDWKIGVAYPTGNLLKTIDRSIQICLAISFACVLVAAIATSQAIKRMLSPIEKINPVMDQVVEGNFSYGIALTSEEDEIGQLQNKLAIMTHLLTDIIEEEKRVLGEMENGNLAVPDMGSLPGDLNEIAVSVNSIKATFNDMISDIQFSAINLQSYAMGINESSDLEEMRSVFEELSAEANALMAKTSEFNTLPK